MAGQVLAQDVALLALGGTDFFSVAPCRAIDTRLPDGPRGGPALVAGSDRPFALGVVCGVPVGATAVSVNIAVSGGTAPGNVRLHAGGTAVPVVSTINYAAGQTRSNNAIVPLSPAGELAAFVGAATGTVHFILDVNGFFASASAVLTGFGPALSFVDIGEMGVGTYPTPLRVSLSASTVVDTFVAVESNDPAVVSVTGGGVVIPTGQADALVLVTGLSAGTATLTATLGLTSMTADVRALDGTETPALVSLLPGTAPLPQNGTLQLTVGLDLPAPAGGTVVALALAPPGAGTVPPTVTVPQGQLSAQFNYVHAGASPSATVSATLDAATLSSQITIPALQLVINEVDYDQPGGTDATEYVEIYNPSGFPVTLTNLALILVNGGASPPTDYARILLDPAGTITAGGYLVITTAMVTVPAPAVRYIPPTAQWPATNAVQNGGPDGMLLVNLSTSTIIDRLSYEGSITNASISGFGTITLVEGTMTTATDIDGAAARSIARFPNGTDTDNAAADWADSTTPTPGAANVP